jgi:hypothetical protein
VLNGQSHQGEEGVDPMRRWIVFNICGFGAEGSAG